MAGCLDPFRPIVDEDILDASPHAWRVTFDDQVDNGVFGPNVVQTEYRFDSSGGPPFPAVMFVNGIRSYPRGSDDAFLDRAREAVEEALEQEGVTVDPEQELRGQRTLKNGVSTEWFRLVGTSQDDAPLFASEEEVRVLGETWFDGLSNTNVVVVALAQTTGPDRGPGGIVTGTQRSHDVWDELVGDPRGSVGGSIHEAGFIMNMVSHD